MLYEVEWMNAMQQTTFLDGNDLVQPIVARARAHDPETSHLAAEQVESSGKADAHRNIIVELIRQHPGSTTGELTQYTTELKHQQIWRRMSELEEMNYVIHGDKRLCKVNKTLCRPWYPK